MTHPQTHIPPEAAHLPPHFQPVQPEKPTLHRRLLDMEIPALMGLDRNRSRWSLTRDFLAGLDAPEPDLTDPRQASAFALVNAAIAAQPFGAPCRPSRGPAECPTLPVTATHQITIPEAPQFGDGPGLAILVPLTRHEWSRDWHPASGPPRPTPEMTARLDALMLCTSARWAAAIPYVDTIRFKHPVVLHHSPERTDHLTSEIWLFVQQIANREMPAPDERASPDYLRQIHEASAHQTEPTEASAELAEQLRDLTAKHRDLDDALAKNAARSRELTETRNELETVISRIVADHGKGSVAFTDNAGDRRTISAKYEHLPAKPPSPKPVARLQIRGE